MNDLQRAEIEGLVNHLKEMNVTLHQISSRFLHLANEENKKHANTGVHAYRVAFNALRDMSLMVEEGGDNLCEAIREYESWPEDEPTNVIPLEKKT